MGTPSWDTGPTPLNLLAVRSTNLRCCGCGCCCCWLFSSPADADADCCEESTTLYSRWMLYTADVRVNINKWQEKKRERKNGVKTSKSRWSVVLYCSRERTLFKRAAVEWLLIGRWFTVQVSGTFRQLAFCSI